jgi:hypothetical protein
LSLFRPSVTTTAAIVLGAGRPGLHSGAYPSFATHPSEQAGLGFFEDFELSVLLIDSESVESDALGLVD